MLSPNKLLLIDDHPDNRALLARTLFRKFPRVAIQECHDLGVAVGSALTEKFDAVVLHRSDDADAVTLVKALRAVNETLPIIVVSGVDRSEAVLAAGATGFLHFDEWLRIGTVVANIVELQEPSEALPDSMTFRARLPNQLRPRGDGVPSEQN